MKKKGFTPLEEITYEIKGNCFMSHLRGDNFLTGFTLIELLITIAIIGILAGAATTAYIGSIKKAARSEAYSNLQNLRILEESLNADSGCYVVNNLKVCQVGAGTHNYTATSPAANLTIENFLPGFKPGGCNNCATPYGLNFTYSITRNVQITGGGNTIAAPPTTAALTPCFVATATAVAGTRVAGDLFAIDCNNRTNY